MIVSASIFQGFIISPDSLVPISALLFLITIEESLIFHLSKQDTSAVFAAGKALPALEVDTVANVCE